jgi:hypothetical protein
MVFEFLSNFYLVKLYEKDIRYTGIVINTTNCEKEHVQEYLSDLSEHTSPVCVNFNTDYPSLTMNLVWNAFTRNDSVYIVYNSKKVLYSFLNEFLVNYASGGNYMEDLDDVINMNLVNL